MGYLYTMEKTLNMEWEILPSSLAPLLNCRVPLNKSFGLPGLLLPCLQIQTVALELLKVISNTDILWVQAEQNPCSSIKQPAQGRFSKLSIKECPSASPEFRDLFLGLGGPQLCSSTPNPIPLLLLWLGTKVPAASLWLNPQVRLFLIHLPPSQLTCLFL